MRISVIIPTHCEASQIVEAVRCAQEIGDEVLVVDAASSDGTAQLARQAGARVLEAAPGRGPQLHAGAAAAAFEVLLFLHADARLPAEAREGIERALRDPAVQAGNFRLEFIPQTPWARFYSACNDWRRRLFSVYYGDSGLFIRRQAYEQLGGFRALPVMEDYELVCRLERAYRTAYLRDITITASARRFAEHPLRTLALWAAVHSLYGLGVPAGLLSRIYRRPADPASS